MSLDQALRRFAAEQAPAPQQRLAFRLCTVVSVTAAGSGGAGDQVVVAIGADNVQAPYLDSYTSRAAGDLVAVLLSDGAPLILGRVKVP